MSALPDLQAAINSNSEAIKEYAERLAEDALSPKSSYSIDGESVSRNEWRASLYQAIESLTKSNMEIFKLINAIQPYWISTRHVV